MKPLSSVLIAVSLLVGSMSVAKAQDLDDLDLTKGVLALQCSDGGDVESHLVFVQSDAGWMLGGSEETVVTEIEDGFRLTLTNNLNWMAFVTGEKSGDWTFRYMSESITKESSCINIQDLVETLTATIAPRIAANFSDIAKEVTGTTPALRDEIAELRQQNEVLEDENIKLTKRETFLTTKLNEINQKNIRLVDEQKILLLENSKLKQ